MKSYIYTNNHLMSIIQSWLNVDEGHDFHQTEAVLSTLNIPRVLKPELDHLMAALHPLLTTPHPQPSEVSEFLSSLLTLYTRLTEFTAIEHYLLSRHL